MNSVKPTVQFSSRGLRNAPVKKTRSMCSPIAATNNSAAQWCICRTNKPPRTSKEMLSVDDIATDISTPFKGTYGPEEWVGAMDAWKKNGRNVPVMSTTKKLKRATPPGKKGQ